MLAHVDSTIRWRERNRQRAITASTGFSMPDDFRPSPPTVTVPNCRLNRHGTPTGAVESPPG
jgi:hypothetical protein